jgi:hypothetical protein
MFPLKGSLIFSSGGKDWSIVYKIIQLFTTFVCQ